MDTKDNADDSNIQKRDPTTYMNVIHWLEIMIHLSIRNTIPQTLTPDVMARGSVYDYMMLASVMWTTDYLSRLFIL